jgi:hypothetical protein
MCDYLIITAAKFRVVHVAFQLDSNPLTTTGCMDLIEAISESDNAITHMSLKVSQVLSRSSAVSSHQSINVPISRISDACSCQGTIFAPFGGSTPTLIEHRK